jgi:5-methyltetrahydrofolate--homocysteine methyltransferase
MGSLLIAAGLRPGECPEAWNLDRPDAVRAIHRDYYAAGACAVLSNTFGANAARLRDSHSPYGVAELNRAGVRLARECCPEGGLVAGDIGPSGVFLEPAGEASEQELEELFFQQAQALVEAGADLICLETFSDLRETRAALRAARRAGPLPVVAAMTFRAGRQGFVTMMGDPLATCLATLRADGAAAVGANCTLSGPAFLALAREIRACGPGPVFLEPNAGEPQPTPEGLRYPYGPEAFADAIGEALGFPDVILGGCCGTTPAHIAALAARL